MTDQLIDDWATPTPEEQRYRCYVFGVNLSFECAHPGCIDERDNQLPEDLQDEPFLRDGEDSTQSGALHHTASRHDMDPIERQIHAQRQRRLADE